MGKYAPENAEGEKPFIVEGWRMGHDLTRLIYAPDAATAKYRAGLRGTGEYVRKVRRALASEVEVDA